VAHVAYLYRRVLIKFVGTHKDYDGMIGHCGRSSPTLRASPSWARPRPIGSTCWRP
jgi:hypothetical protein